MEMVTKRSMNAEDDLLLPITFEKTIEIEVTVTAAAAEM